MILQSEFFDIKVKLSLNLATAINFTLEHSQILFPNRIKSKI